MAVTQYIGSRYVPLFADPIEWDTTKSYEPLTIVYYQGNSYTSKQAVPTGVEITNTTYWAITGNYNAQIEQYRQEVRTFDGRISANTAAISSEESARQTADQSLASDIADNTTAISTEATTRSDADDALDDKIDTEISDRTAADTTLQSNITAEATARASADDALDDKIDAEISNRISADDALDVRVTALENGGGAFDEIVKRLDLMQLKSGNMVVLGDSYSQEGIENSANAHWCHRIANGYGLDLFNFAIAGAGWGRQSGLIASQQTTCTNTMTADEKANTGLVIGYAGCNDLLNGIDVPAIVNGINGFITWALTTFPNAAIMVIPFNYGFGGLTSNIYKTIHQTFIGVNGGVLHPRVKLVPYAWVWNFGDASRYRNQNHPNESGYNAISNYILNAMHGVETVLGRADHVSFASGNLSEIIIDYNVTNDDVSFIGRVKSTQAGAQSNTLVANTTTSLSSFTRTELHLLPLYSGNPRTVCGELRFLADGSVQVNLNSSYIANDNLWFEGSFKCQNGIAWHA